MSTTVADRSEFIEAWSLCARVQGIEPASAHESESRKEKPMLTFLLALALTTQAAPAKDEARVEASRTMNLSLGDRPVC